MDNDEREWHPSFKEYVEMIVSHYNYDGLFFERKQDGEIKWVVTGNSAQGKRRRRWWDEQCRRNKVSIKAGCYAEIARIVHPTGHHVCQICGRSMSIQYVYPTQNLLKKLNRICDKLRIPKFEYAKDDIQNILATLLNRPSPPFEDIREIFQIPNRLKNNLKEISSYIDDNFVKKNSKLLSPGVMSNSPDRFDGFHSDGLCCRSSSDKGRHKPNMMRYGEDRRAYESWASGNWKLASWLMKEYSKIKANCLICGEYQICSADHIGPLSCGFAHSAFFNPLCKPCNSSKNNRMSLSDIMQLISIEKREPVISWHSNYIWNEIKHNAATDEDAVSISELMRENLHNILSVFSAISERKHNLYLLRFLNPQYAFFQYEFRGYDLKGLARPDNIIEYKVNRTEHRRNAIRYIRISLESLEKYSTKVNRKIKFKDLLAVPAVKKELIRLFDILDKIYPDKFSVDSLELELSRNILAADDRDRILAYLKQIQNCNGYIKIADAQLKRVIDLIGDELKEHWAIALIS